MHVALAAAAKFTPSFLVVVDVLSTADVTVDVTVVMVVKYRKARFSPIVNESSMKSFWEDTTSGVAATDCKSAKALASTLIKEKNSHHSFNHSLLSIQKSIFNKLPCS